MMQQTDLKTLQDMLNAISTYANPGQLADRLLLLRDQLEFDDARWYHELTQHMATLDSASTFHPVNDAEKRHLEAAVQQAIDQITALVGLRTR